MNDTKSENKAIVVKTDEHYEARCRCCGKLLFVFDKNPNIHVDEMKRNVIIVSRCTRSCCKTDNVIII